VLQYLRIQRLDEEDIAAVARQQNDVACERVSDRNEVEILQFLRDSISGLLEGFRVQVEALEKQLAKGVYSEGSNAWAAAHVSLGEQRILLLAKQRANDLLSTIKHGDENQGKLPLVVGQCANCGSRPTGKLMLCGRCKTVSYCGRACQVAHYKQHKTTCQALTSR